MEGEPGEPPKAAAHLALLPGGQKSTLGWSVLVGAGAFCEALARDVEAARRRVLVQTLSFEGDRAGRWLTDRFLSSSCPDRRLLVDEYSLVKVSDRFVRFSKGQRDPELCREQAEMARAIEELRADGVRVLFTNPMGPAIVRFPARNHKKLVVVDDAAYLGGINFSDHNFAWHDMMLRIEDPALAGFLAADVDATFKGVDQRVVASFAGVQLHLLDGRSNEIAYQPVLDVIDGARDTIFVESPYITHPFLDRLIEAGRRGVEVVLVMPEESNYPTVSGYTTRTASRAGIHLRSMPGMIHLKAMLVDGRTLVMGSSNMDIVSYRCEQEIVAVVTAPEAIARFTRAVVDRDMAMSREWAHTADKPWLSSYCRLQLLGVEIWSLLARSV